MKIENNSNRIKSAISGAATDEKGLSARADARKGAAPSAATVQLSALSARLRHVESHLDATPVVDAARVAEIKQAITDGRFKINADVVADKLIDTVRELIRSHKA